MTARAISILGKNLIKLELEHSYDRLIKRNFHQLQNQTNWEQKRNGPFIQLQYIYWWVNMVYRIFVSNLSLKKFHSLYWWPSSLFMFQKKLNICLCGTIALSEFSLYQNRELKMLWALKFSTNLDNRFAPGIWYLTMHGDILRRKKESVPEKFSEGYFCHQETVLDFDSLSSNQWSINQSIALYAENFSR